MNNIYIYTILILFSCNHSLKNRNEPKTDFPKEVSEKRLEELYTNAKWVLYCICCDKKCILSEEIQPIRDTTVEYGMLNLKLQKINYLNDTTEFIMDFYYNDTIKCDVNTIYHFTSIPSGLAFKGNSTKIIYSTNYTTVPRMSYLDSDSSFRAVKPLQPEVISYIKNNKDKLNPWFREEAKRRKVID